MALSQVGVSAAPIFGTTSATATLPAGYTVTAGDRAYLFVVSKRSASATPATPANWNSLGTFAGGGGTAGAGAGPVRLNIFWKDLVGGDTLPAVTITTHTGVVISSACAIYRKGAGEDFDHALVSWEDTGSSTTFSGTFSANPGLTSGDRIALLSGVTLSTATFGATSVDIATGATISALSENHDHSTTNGDDLRVGLHTGSVTAGTCTVAPHSTTALSTASTGAQYMLRVRAIVAPVTHQGTVTLSATPSITVAGTVTTPGANPEFIAYYENNQGTTVTTTTASFTPAAGETILVKCYNDDLNTPNVSGVSGGGLTYDLILNEALASNSECWLYAADVGGTSPGAMTVSVTWTGTGGRHGIVVERYKNTQKPTAVGNTPLHGSGAPSSSITTTENNSIISWFNADWQAVAGAATYRAGSTEIFRLVHANVVLSSAYLATTTKGAHTLGQTAPAGQTWTLLAVELKPTGAGPPPGGGGGATVKARDQGKNDTPATAHTVSWPAGAVAGELLLCFFTNDNATCFAFSDDPGIVNEDTMSQGTTTNHTCSVFWKRATGGDTSFVVDLTESQEATWTTYRIETAEDPETAPMNQGSAGSFTPAPITPSDGLQDYLVIIGVGVDASTSSSNSLTFPAGYTNVLSQNPGILSSAGTFSAEQLYTNVSTITPGTVTLSAAEQVVAFTVAIKATQTAVTHQGTVTLSATPSITTDGLRTAVSTVSLVELPTITTAGLRTAVSSVSLVELPSITVAANAPEKIGTVNLTATVTLGAQVLPFVHSSSPPLVPGATGTGPVTTATFTPPPDALLVAVVGANQNTLTDIAWTMSSTGVTGLTWTTAIDADTADAANANCGASGILVAQLPPSGIVPMTVTMNSNGAGANYIKLYVVVNARSGVAAIGQTAKGAFNNSQVVSGSLTARTGDLVLFGATEWQASSPLASTEFDPIEQFDTGSTLSAIVGQKTMGTGAWQFSSVAASPRWTYSIVEIIGTNVAVGVTQQGTVGLTATPSITTNGTVTRPSTVTLTALPSITTAALRTAESSVTLVQLPTISAAGIRTAVSTVTLIELPTITVGQFVIRPATVSLSVLPSITIATERIAVSSVLLVQLPTLSTPAFVIRPSTVTLSLLPSITLTSTVLGNIAATVTLVQLPTIAAAAKQEWFASVNLVCLPTVAVGGTRVGISTVLLSQAVSITTAGLVTTFGTVSLVELPSITVSGLVTKLPTVLLTALPTITVDQFVIRPSTVSLVALTSIAAVSGGQTSGTVSLVVLPSVAVDGERTAVSSVLLTLSPSLSAGALQAFAATVQLVLAPSVVVAGALRTVPAAVTLVQLSSVTVAADRFAISTVTLVQIATIAAAGAAVGGGSVVLSAITSITISTRITHASTVTLVLAPEITVGPFVLRRATVTLTQTPTLGVGTFALTAATVTLSQDLSIVVSGVRVRDGSVSLILAPSIAIGALVEGFALAVLTADVSISVAASISSFIVAHLVQQVIFGAGGANVVGGQATLIALVRFFAYITVAEIALPITITGIDSDGFRSGRWTRQPSSQWPKRTREPSWTKQDSGARFEWLGT